MLDAPELKIDEAYEKEPPGWPSKSISASVVGNPCDAFLAFNLRSFPETPPPPFARRIFKLGHAIEEMVIEDLRKAGYTVWDKDPLTGKQFKYTLYGGHVVAKLDGHIEMENGEVLLLEIKSMNAASFDRFKKHGVRISHPKYYMQLQLSMGLSGFSRSLFISYCKDNSRYASQVVKFDAFDYAAAHVKIDAVMANKATKVATDASDWRCKDCSKRGVCWEAMAVPRVCTTCRHAIARQAGDWMCLKHGREATESCDDYEQYEPLPRS